MDYESEEEADREQDGDDKDGQEGEGEEEQEEEKKDSPEVSVSSEFTEMKRVKKKKRRTKEGGEEGGEDEGEEGGEEEGMSQLRVNSVLQSHPAVERYCYDYKHELWCQVGVGGDEWTRRSEVMVVCSTASLPQC